jgi:hypothetical protein
VSRQIELKRLLPSYGRYARFRKLVRKETAASDLSSAVVLFRDRKELLPLYGGKCPKCGTVQFPKHRVCIECAHPGGLEEVKLARRGKLFTFTNDYLFDSPDRRRRTRSSTSTAAGPLPAHRHRAGAWRSTCRSS